MTAEDYAKLYGITPDEGRVLKDTNTVLKLFGVPSGIAYYSKASWYNYRYQISYKDHEGGIVKTIRYKTAEAASRGAKKLALRIQAKRVR
jgi:hypothetical protein